MRPRQELDSEYRWQSLDFLQIYSRTAQGILLFSVNDCRNIALADYITRRIYKIITREGYDIPKVGSWSDAKGGDFRIDCPGQQILQVLPSVHC